MVSKTQLCDCFETSIPFCRTGTIDEKITAKLFNQLPNIKELTLSGKLSYFSLDTLVKLNKLRLEGSIKENFNFDLFKNISKQLMILILNFDNDDDEILLSL